MIKDFRMPLQTRLLILCLSLPILLSSHAAVGLNPKVSISQYAHTTWRAQDGSFEGSPIDVTQTTDGYLWLGTTTALYRFDGVHFVRVPLPKLTPLGPQDVFALLGARDGSLWVSNCCGVFQWKDGGWKRALKFVGRVNSLREGPNGVIWAAQSRTGKGAGGFCSITTMDFQCFGKEMEVTTAAMVSPRSDGSLRVGLADGVLEWKDGRGKLVKTPHSETTSNLQAVTDIVEEADGSSLIGMISPGPGRGLQRLSREGVWSPFEVQGFDGASVSVVSLLQDREGSLWVGTLGQGIYRVHDGTVSHYGHEEGLTSNGINNSFQDSEGNLWFTTATGLDRFHDLAVVTFADDEGLNAPSVAAVAADKSGTIWISNIGGLGFIRDGKFQVLDHSHGLQGNRLTSLLEDSQGRLWLGVDNKLAVYEAGHFRFINRSDGSTLGPIETLTEDTSHTIWVKVVGSKPGTLVRVDSLFVVSEVDIPNMSHILNLTSDPRGGIWLHSINEGIWHYQDNHAEPISNVSVSTSKSVRSMLTQEDGSLFAATRTGFFRWQNGTLRTFGVANGLPCPVVYSMILSRLGSLWLYSECGVIQVTRDQLKSWWNNPKVSLSLRAFGAQDGALPASPTFTPKAAESLDGRLWFATNTVLQMVDPAHLEPNALPPPVHIEGINADRKGYAPEQRLKLPKLTGDLEIDYTALSLVSSEKVHFKYKLDGFDSDWQDVGTRREAFYTNLGPKHYVFHVIACNNDSVWNSVGDSLAFSIAPAYYQMVWFKLVCVFVALLVPWLLFRLRLQQATQTVRERLAGQVAERERIARELHDTFLQGLYAVLLRFHTIADNVRENPAVQGMMADALNRADAVLVQGRESLRDLRGDPSSMTTVAEELECFAQGCRVDSEARFSLVITGEPHAFHPVIRDEIIQIGKEAILNAFRHSEAADIHVELCYERTFFSLTVRDDGRGIDPLILAAGGRTGHWGMLGMRERCRKIGAQFSISSPAPGGTEVKLRIPSTLAYASAAHFGFWSKWLIQRQGNANIGSEA